MSDDPKQPYVNIALAESSRKPWRKVHLDFHNSQHIPVVGNAFDAEEFGATLINAHVNGIVVFAKDMHGYFYYPSEYGPVHHGLTFDLLGQQVSACRDHDIKVYAYYCVTWDNYLAEEHPEWLVVKRDRTTYLPKFDETPRWTALCLTNRDFVQLVLDQSREILECYAVDGIWYDMPLPISGECFCRNCLKEIREQGNDPFDTAAQRRHKQALLVDFMREAHHQAQEIRPGCQVDHNNQTRFGLAERIPYMTNVDIEALPTGGWGYYYFPAHVRYSRNFGKTVYGMTGRFHRSWADFGGLKRPEQLETELAWIVAQGALCDIGDQAPPNGRLDPAVYETIGGAFRRIKALEPYLQAAAPVTEAAIVVSGLPLDELATRGEGSNDHGSYPECVYGFTKLLSELHIQFDIVEPHVELSRYRLLILPENLQVDDDLATQLDVYLEQGGSVFASGESILQQSTGHSWLTSLPIESMGYSPYQPAFLTWKDSSLGSLWNNLPSYEYALYDGALQIRSSDPGIVHARLGEPLFQRSPEHYTSHSQTPFDHDSEYAAVLVKGSLAVTAFPIGSSYFRHGYWIYREVFDRLVRQILPHRLITTNAPTSADVTVTRQENTDDHPTRWLVHIVNFSSSRRSPHHLEYYEDAVPLHDVGITLSIRDNVTKVYQVTNQLPLEVEHTSDGCSVVVTRVGRSEILVFEAAS
jgi:hypothetical protein